MGFVVAIAFSQLHHTPKRLIRSNTLFDLLKVIIL
jgi:hypothetical protein